MKVKEYPVLEEAVIDGVNMGYRRAYKHTNRVEEKDLKESIVFHVLGQIDERFDFDE